MVMHIKEEEITVFDGDGTKLETYWRIGSNPRLELDLNRHHKTSGRWRYRKVEYVDDESKARIYPDTWKETYKCGEINDIL